MNVLPFRPATDSLTLRLDRAASILRNYHDEDFALCLTDFERGLLSTLLTEACNAICEMKT